MESNHAFQPPPIAEFSKPTVKFVGVGTAGITMLGQLHPDHFPQTERVAINTDHSAVLSAAECLHLESKQLRGLGAGGDPERGRELAEEHFDRLKAVGAAGGVVCLIAGLGGGTGTGVSPVLARAARESGALVLAFVTLPFACEGNQRQRQARQGLEQLVIEADGVICLPLEKAATLLAEHAAFADAFRASAQLLIDGVRGVWQLLHHRGLIEIHYAELCELLRASQGASSFASVESVGPARAREAIAKLSTHPLFDGGQALAGAETVLVSLMGGPELSLTDVNQVMAEVTKRCPKARLLMGAALDAAFHDRLRLTVIASGQQMRPGGKLLPGKSGKTGSGANAAPDFTAELLHPLKPERPGSRHVPPAPSLTAEQRDHILAQQAGKGARTRKSGPRMKQITLPLDIVNKGRFDKSEPTIHKGEDLDLPTYVRRGVSLN